MTRTESEWTEEQQGWMLAYALWEAYQCRQCGGDLHETTDVDNDPANMGGTGMYVALPPDECFRCTALHKAHSDYSKSTKAFIHRVERLPRAPRIPRSKREPE